MKLTRQEDYAMRAVLYLAGNPRATTSEIAEAQNVPKDYLMKTFQLLADKGIVITHRGSGGGVSLAMPAKDVSMLDVIEAISGPLALNQCFVEPGVCEREAYCSIHLELDKIQEELVAKLASRNFAELARMEAKYHRQLVG